MPLTWRGDEVKARVRRASVAAIEETNTAAAAIAAAEWPVRTGLSRANIEVLEHASPSPGGAAGTWGGRELPPSSEYSESSRRRILFEEIGVEGRPGLNILRWTADRMNAHLAREIRSRLR